MYYVYVFIKLGIITAQSGHPAIVVILCYSHWSSHAEINNNLRVCVIFLFASVSYTLCFYKIIN